METDQIITRRDFTANYNDDTRISAFKTSDSSDIKDTDDQSDLFDHSDTSDKSSDSVITFGDELDIPAFIRNRREND